MQNLEWLMILNGISEYEKTVKLLIEAEIRHQTKDKKEEIKHSELISTLLTELKTSNSITEETYKKIMMKIVISLH